MTKCLSQLIKQKGLFQLSVLEAHPQSHEPIALGLCSGRTLWWDRVAGEAISISGQ